MLLVMDSAGVFSTGESGHSPLWALTWDRINAFLPHLQQELVKAQPPPPPPPPPGTIRHDYKLILTLTFLLRIKYRKRLIHSFYFTLKITIILIILRNYK